MKVAGYGRVSTTAQMDGTSPEEQKRKITEECLRQGYQLVKIYFDEGKSGHSITSRTGLQQLINDAKAKKFDIVMFTKLDRLGRNLRDLLNIWELLQEELNLDLICLEEPSVNTKGKFGKVTLAVIGAFAEFERTTIKERTSGGRLTKWKNAEAIMGNLPFCYYFDKEEKDIKADKEQVEVYNKIISMYIDEHFSTTDIANKLTEEGIPTPSAKAKNYKEGKKAVRWNNATVRKILKNEAYKGELISNRFQYKSAISEKGREYMFATDEEKPEKDWIKIKLPQLITDDRFDEIQVRREQQKSKSRREFKGYEDHFLVENMLYCGICDGKMHKRTRDKANGELSLHYRCFWRYASEKQLILSNHKRCPSKAMDAAVIDEIAFTEVVKVLSDPGKFAEQWLENKDIKELKSRVEHLRKQETTLKMKLKNAFNIITSTRDINALRVFEKERKVFEKDYQDVLFSLRKAEREYSLYEDKVDRLNEFKQAMMNANRREKMHLAFSTQAKFMEYLFNLPFKEKKRVVEAVIGNDGKCKVYYEGKEPVVYMDFKLDLDKIQALIGGLSKNKLSLKFSAHTVSRQRENANHKRCI